MKQDTGDIYGFNKSLDHWAKVGGPAKQFVATGGSVYNLDANGEDLQIHWQA